MLIYQRNLAITDFINDMKTSSLIISDYEKRIIRLKKKIHKLILERQDKDNFPRVMVINCQIADLNKLLCEYRNKLNEHTKYQKAKKGILKDMKKKYSECINPKWSRNRM